MKSEISDEQLNAFVDGELDAADRERVLAAIAADGELAQRACSLRLVKEQVCHAFAEPPAAPVRRLPHHRWRALGSIMLLASAVAVGWLARDYMLGAVGQSAPKTSSAHVVLHLSTGTTEQARMALDSAEGLLHTARESGQPIDVELVANAGGLDLLRTSVSPEADRIAALREAHPNFVVIACGQSIERLREKGIEVRLLPGTRVATSALDQIVARMGQGWAYVRI